MSRRSTIAARSVILGVFGSVVCLLTPGCADPDRAVGFDQPSPAARLRAVRQAAETDDRSAIKPLIELLDSDDPVERMTADQALRKITGRDFGYNDAAPREQREAAVRRWAEWYAQSVEKDPAAGGGGSSARSDEPAAGRDERGS